MKFSVHTVAIALGIALASFSSAGRHALAADPKPAPDVAGKPVARLSLGDPAPEIAATTLEGKPISIVALHGDDAAHPKYIVLQFGSITEPIFRAHASAVEHLAKQMPDTVNFVIVYQQEAHAADTDAAIALNVDEGFGISQPLSIAERQKLAKQMVEMLHIKTQTVVVDAWNNTSALRYGSYPNMTFIIDGKGVLQAGYAWMDAGKVKLALDTLIVGKPLPPELKGSVKLSSSAPLDFTGAAMEMTGGRGPATIAMALEKINLTDQQRNTLYPAVAQYLADLQTFRQTRGNLPGAPARVNPPPPAAGDARATTKPATPQDVQMTLEDLRTSAGKLKAVIKQTVPAKDATALFDALEQTQQQHLFTNP